MGSRVSLDKHRLYPLRPLKAESHNPDNNSIILGKALDILTFDRFL